MQTFQSFSDLDLPKPLAAALLKMKFTVPTPVQAATIGPALKGRDILGIAQTGTGKTGAFGVPLLAALYPNPGKQALVLAPTRELAAQIKKVLEKMSVGMKLNGTLLVGGESFNRQVAEIRRGVDYIIATPGRLNDHLEQRTVNLSQVRIFVLDEVDRMLDMGFAPQIRAILKYVPKTRQTLLFSATLPQELNGVINGMMKDPVKVSLEHVVETAPKVTQEKVEVSEPAKMKQLLKEIDTRKGRILIFARTQSRTERVAQRLYDEGHDIVCMHGGRSNGQRKEALRRYHAGTHRIMVATDLAGRGIDVDDIAHVINYDVPGNREDYIHRIGRTGRFGKTGIAITFVTPVDVDADYIISGKKKPSRVVFSNRRWGRRR